MSSETFAEPPSRRHASPVPWKAMCPTHPVFERPDVFPSDLFPHSVLNSLTRKHLLPTPDRFHTFFEPRDTIPYLMEWTGSLPCYYALPHTDPLSEIFQSILHDLVEPRTLCECQDWQQVEQVLRAPLPFHPEYRTCFRYAKHFFLTRKYFTFGERKVKEHTQHVIQVGNRPFHLLFRYAVNEDYHPMVLEANTWYSLPSPLRYIVYTFNRTLFALHVVKEGGPLPFPNLEEPHTLPLFQGDGQKPKRILRRRKRQAKKLERPFTPGLPKRILRRRRRQAKKLQRPFTPGLHPLVMHDSLISDDLQEQKRILRRRRRQEKKLEELCKQDLFPTTVHDSLERDDLLPQPYQFSSLLVRNDIQAFLIHLYQDIVHYSFMWFNDRLKRHFKKLQSSLFRSQVDWRGNWQETKELLEQINIRKYRRQRTGFKCGESFFLTQKHFTFGQRFVEENTQHVIQVGNRPLSLYFLEENHATNGHRLFRSKEQGKYRQQILNANSVYTIPSKNVYILHTAETTFFALHIVKEGAPLRLFQHYSI